jgi:hypothetical protein
MLDAAGVEDVAADAVGVNDVRLVELVSLGAVVLAGRKARSRCSKAIVMGCAHIVIGPAALRVVEARSVLFARAGTSVVRPLPKLLTQPRNICVLL